MIVANTTETKNDRIYFIDLLRIISCFFVIINHTNSRIFQAYTPSLTWFASLFYLFLSKAAVPIFIMISGYTLLHRQDSHLKNFRRLFRYGCTLLLFSILYYLLDCLSGKEVIYWKYFLPGLLGEPYTNAFWYMYSYLGILLMLPFLQKLVSVLSKADFYLFFLVSSLFFSLWPIVAHYVPLLTISVNFSIPLFHSTIMFLLMGFYFRTYCTPSRKWRIPCLLGYILTCLLNVFFTYIEYTKFNNEDYLFFDNRVSFPVVIGAFCLFCFVSTFEIKAPLNRVISEVGKLTFGIYLVSDCVIEKCEFIYTYMVHHQISVLPAMFIYEVAVFVIGAFVVYILRKIPIFRYLL